MNNKIGRSRFTSTCVLYALALLSVFSVYLTQPIVTTIEQHFKVSSQLASLSFTITSLGYCLALPFYSTLAAKFGFKKVIVSAIFLLSLSAIFLVFDTGYIIFLGMRFLQGVFAAGIPAIGMAYIHTVFPQSQQMHGIFVSGLLSGALLSRVISGLVTYYIGLPFLFGFLALLNLTVGILAFIILKEDAPFGKLNNPLRIFLELKNPIIAYGCISSFCFIGAFTSIYNSISFWLINTLGLNEAEIGMLFLFGFTGPITAFFSGRIFRKNQPLYWVFFCYALATIAINLFSISSIESIIISLMIFNFAIFGIHSIISSLIAQMGWQKSHATSLYMIFYYLGGTVGAAVSGFVYYTFGWNSVLVESFVFLVFGTLTNLRLIRTSKNNI